MLTGWKASTPQTNDLLDMTEIDCQSEAKQRGLAAAKYTGYINSTINQYLQMVWCFVRIVVLSTKLSFLKGKWSVFLHVSATNQWVLAAERIQINRIDETRIRCDSGPCLFLSVWPIWLSEHFSALLFRFWGHTKGNQSESHFYEPSSEKRERD